RYIYAFGAGRKDGRADMKDLLGGKGANLAEMARLGLPVPPGFTISTEVCTYYYANRRTYPPALRARIAEALARVEKGLGRRVGAPLEGAPEENERARGVKLDTDLDADALRELVAEFKALVRMRKGAAFPDDPHEQLWGAIGAVFGSWMNQRAIVYRKLNNI